MATFDITESNGSQNSKLLDFSWFVKSEKITSALYKSEYFEHLEKKYREDATDVSAAATNVVESIQNV